MISVSRKPAKPHTARPQKLKVPTKRSRVEPVRGQKKVVHYDLLFRPYTGPLTLDYTKIGDTHAPRNRDSTASHYDAIIS